MRPGVGDGKPDRHPVKEPLLHRQIKVLTDVEHQFIGVRGELLSYQERLIGPAIGICDDRFEFRARAPEFDAQPVCGAAPGEVERVCGESAHVGLKLTEAPSGRKVFLVLKLPRCFPLPWFCCLGLALLLAPHTVRAAQLTQKSISYEGGTRTWEEHVPASYDGSKAVPLVLVLHGAYDSGSDFADRSGWPPVSDANGFIAIFPDGEGTNGSLVWHSWTFDGSKPDDIGFLLQVIAQVKATYHIDTTRVYMTGFSNGGGMTSFFAAAHADVLAAIAPLSAGWITTTGMSDSRLAPDAPLPAWVWRGALDTTDGGATPITTQDEQQTAFWAKLDSDVAARQITTTLGTETTSIFPGGTAEVRYTNVSDLAHDVAPNCASRVWTEFFSRFSRQGTTISDSSLPRIKVRATSPKASAADGTKGIFVLTRDGDPTAPLTVNYQVEGTAVGGIDYKALSGVVAMAAGSASAKVKVRAKLVGETVKKTVRLSVLPGDGYGPDDPAVAKVKIVEGQ